MLAGNFTHCCVVVLFSQGQCLVFSHEAVSVRACGCSVYEKFSMVYEMCEMMFIGKQAVPLRTCYAHENRRLLRRNLCTHARCMSHVFFFFCLFVQSSVAYHL